MTSFKPRGGWLGQHCGFMIQSTSHLPVRPRKFAAWLGVFALCLTVLMPLLSQWFGAPGRLEQAVCSASHGVLPAPADGSSAPPAHDGLDACGYCSLLTHTPFVASGSPALAGFAPPPVAALLAAVAPPRFDGRHRRALPRAPPLA